MIKQILQIIPATDWYSVHDGGGMYVPLAAWALVEYEDGCRGITGIEATPFEALTPIAEGQRSFQGYIYRPVDLSKVAGT